MKTFQPTQNRLLCRKVHLKYLESNILESPPDTIAVEGEYYHDKRPVQDLKNTKDWLSFKVAELPIRYEGKLKKGDIVMVNKHYCLHDLEEYGTLIHDNLIEFLVDIPPEYVDPTPPCRPKNFSPGPHGKVPPSLRKPFSVSVGPR